MKCTINKAGDGTIFILCPELFTQGRRQPGVVLAGPFEMKQTPKGKWVPTLDTVRIKLKLMREAGFYNRANATPEEIRGQVHEKYRYDEVPDRENGGVKLVKVLLPTVIRALANLV